MSQPLTVDCPTCGAPVEWNEKSPFRPFCSDRCKLIDLGAWAAEEHKIPGRKSPRMSCTRGTWSRGIDPIAKWLCRPLRGHARSHRQPHKPQDWRGTCRSGLVSRWAAKRPPISALTQRSPGLLGPG